MSDRPEPSKRTVSRRAVLSTLASASALGALAPGVAAAGRPDHHAVAKEVSPVQADGRFEYVVKFLCGFSEGEAVVPGTYRTAVNVHNPTEDDVEACWKVAVAGADEPGEVTQFDEFVLGPDEAVEIDCVRIAERIDVRERFFKGFVVIRTDRDLDVVAVYTAGGEDQLVRTLDVEDVQPRDAGGEPDGGGDRLPDLVPEVVDCGREIVVRVANQGAGPAGPSTTVVDFGQYGTRTAETPAIDPGDSTVHGFVPDLGCYDPDCDFRVTVDANGVVDESNEDNNVLEDRCLG